LIAVLVAAVVLVAGCPKPQSGRDPVAGPPSTGPIPGAGPKATPAAAGEVTLYVPCGMIIPVRAVMDAFEKQNPDTKLNGVFDNAGVLVERMEKKGEKADIFISPGSQEYKSLVEAGLAEEDETRPIGDFELVVVTNREATLEVKSAEDLRKCKTISIPDPELNSVGVSGKEALTKLGLWDELEPKMVKTKHAITSHTMVASGKSDAGIAYRNCPLETNPEKLSKSKVQVAFQFPADTYTKQQCLIAPLKGAANPEGARKFLEFITSDEGLKILSDNGMTGCLTLGASGKGTEASAAGGEKVDTSNAKVSVRAFYPDNEGHKKVKDMILGLPAKYEGKVKSEFIDFTSGEGFDKWREAGLSCGAILINDRQTWSYVKDGKVKEVTFKMAIDGEWTEADLNAVIEKLLSESE